MLWKLSSTSASFCYDAVERDEVPSINRREVDSIQERGQAFPDALNASS